uniref:Bradykinin-potentiating peptide 11h n=1 Tax=Bothrops jararaca TaxID=8724 RepID=BPPBH_BOTJA|nr:RecName: Full=Bradykinin-potentiating peptide 11h; Short=BPP-11h [Bothrops jararaca]
QGRHPPIPPAP